MSNEFTTGEGKFTFTNQDVYEGQYCAHVSGLAWREGVGSYHTHDGQVYEGNWKDDKLDETQNMEISFPDDHRYVGRVSKYKYNGPGTYHFGDIGRLTCEFLNNKPTGNIIYIDDQDKIWYGKALEECVDLNREHVFSYELDSERGKGASLNPSILEITEEEVASEQTEELDLKELEKLVFAKSTKTASEIDFEDSSWYEDFKEFSIMYDQVMSTVRKSGIYCLTAAQKQWYKRFRKSTKILDNIKKKHLKDTAVSCQVLKEYLMEMLKETCPRMVMFQPTPIEEVPVEDAPTKDAEQEEQVEQVEQVEQQ